MVREGHVAALFVAFSLGACSESPTALPPEALQSAHSVHKVTHLPGSVGVTNPCNGQFVQGSTSVTLAVNQVVSASGQVQVVVRRTVTGTALSASGTPYQYTSQAKGHFSEISAFYDLDHRSRMDAPGAALDFTFNGMVRVNVDVTGTPTGSLLLSLTPICTPL